MKSDIEILDYGWIQSRAKHLQTHLQVLSGFAVKGRERGREGPCSVDGHVISGRFPPAIAGVEDFDKNLKSVSFGKIELADRHLKESVGIGRSHGCRKKGGGVDVAISDVLQGVWSEDHGATDRAVSLHYEIRGAVVVDPGDVTALLPVVIIEDVHVGRPSAKGIGRLAMDRCAGEDQKAEDKKQGETEQLFHGGVGRNVGVLLKGSGG